METTTRTIAGRYRLLGRLGAGSMGTVWRAQDLALGREVAVKEVAFPPGVGEREREVLRERTRREARMAAGLDHPSAVTVYDVAEEDGTTYVVMELVPSRTLAEVIRADGPLSPSRTAQVGLGVLGALVAAHARGIVHRDVKPGNVLVRDDGRVVLTDFGISTSTSDPSLTTTGVLVGSPAYMSPERARGETPGPPSDLWSLGATLFAAVEGRPPFDRCAALATLSAVLTEPPEPFVAAGPLGPVLAGLLDKDPHRRLDAAGARDALTQIAQTPDLDAASVRPTRAVVATGTAAAPLRDVWEAVDGQAGPRVGRRSLVPLGVLALLGGLGAGAYALSSTGSHSSRARPTLSAAPAPSVATKASRSAPAGSSGVSSGTAAAAPTATPAAQRSSPAPSGPASGGAGVPAGWTTYTAGQGWSVAHPPGWTAGSYHGLVQLRDPVTGRTLRVDTTSSPKGDPVTDWQEQSSAFAGNHPGYRELRIEKVTYRDDDAADWEFTYPSGGRVLHVLNRGFVVNPTRAYALYWQTGDADWSAARSTFDEIAASFQPGS